MHVYCVLYAPPLDENVRALNVVCREPDRAAVHHRQIKPRPAASSLVLGYSRASVRVRVPVRMCVCVGM